ncbi:hypothetical protein CDAR_217591 [Caerostris darwini]|uniref:Uncharacterized protein n=1 Tax=Caerostris darwini TaxID=1538125 RepID=A0AAV4U9B3_9ARAC|nr:hypothetical protein CDAR_217591 [Caerostris darwini]
MFIILNKIIKKYSCVNTHCLRRLEKLRQPSSRTNAHLKQVAVTSLFPCEGLEQGDVTDSLISDVTPTNQRPPLDSGKSESSALPFFCLREMNQLEIFLLFCYKWV